MSRPRKSLSELEKSGALHKNPKRYQERIDKEKEAAELPPIGPPPERWDVNIAGYQGERHARMREIWQEFAPQIARGTMMKRALLEMFCECMDRFRTKPLLMKTSEKAYLLQLTKALGVEEGSLKSQKGDSDGTWCEF